MDQHSGNLHFTASIQGYTSTVTPRIGCGNDHSVTARNSRFRIVQVNVIGQHSGNLHFTASIQSYTSTVTPRIGCGNDHSVRKPLQSLHTSHTKTAGRFNLDFGKSLSQSSQQFRRCDVFLDPNLSADQPVKSRSCDGFVDRPSTVDDLADGLQKGRSDPPAPCRTQCHHRSASSVPMLQDDSGGCVGPGHGSWRQLVGMGVARARPQVVVVDKSELRMGDLCSEYRLDRLRQCDDVSIGVGDGKVGRVPGPLVVIHLLQGAMPAQLCNEPLNVSFTR